jgi:DNA-binding MarR family transcriptional regulator
MSNAPNKPAAPVRGCTCFRLRKLTRRVTQHYDAHLAAAGLRITQFSVLTMLEHAEGLSVSELAERLEMDRTTLSRNLGPLEAAGWVETGARRDARSRALRITAAGRETWARAKPLWRRAQDELNQALGLEQVAGLHALLDDSLARFHLAQAEASSQ